MTVHFVGAGPGAADLLTVRAVQLLRACGVCLYPGSYLDPEVLEHCASGARLIDTQGLDLDEIIGEIVAADAAGMSVVRLCSGDPAVYSALTEQTRRLDKAGVAWDVTPGVPAYAAAAARLGVELTVPRLVQSVVLTRTQARSTPMPETEELARLAASRATLVLHVAIRRIAPIADELVEFYGPSCPVAVVYRASQPTELVLRGTLTDIAEQVQRAQLQQAAVIMVGHALGETPADCESHLYDPNRERITGAVPGTLG